MVNDSAMRHSDSDALEIELSAKLEDFGMAL
jgi:hypothetical protein